MGPRCFFYTNKITIATFTDVNQTKTPVCTISFYLEATAANSILTRWKYLMCGNFFILFVVHWSLHGVRGCTFTFRKCLCKLYVHNIGFEASWKHAMLNPYLELWLELGGWVDSYRCCHFRNCFQAAVHSSWLAGRVVTSANCAYMQKYMTE